MEKFESLIIGTGLCAKFVYLGMNSSGISDQNIRFIQVKKSQTNHFSMVLKHGGMASFWHKGLMSPGLQTLSKYGIKKEQIKEFDRKFCPQINHSSPEMLISEFPKRHFIAPKEYTIKVSRILDIRVAQNNSKIIVYTNQYNETVKICCENLILCASTIGNLEILNLISKDNLKTYLNDHDMNIIPDDPNLPKSPLWKEELSSISERRPTIMFPKGLILSPKVHLLTIPIIGRILYGLNAPRLALDAVLKKIIKPRKFYTFKLDTPKVSAYKYQNGKITNLKSIISAFHITGDEPIISAQLEKKQIFCVSGLNIGKTYKFFPSYLLALMSYSLGKKIEENE